MAASLILLCLHFISFALVSTRKQGFIPGVTLSLNQKQTFYHELEQFVRNGIPLPQAVEALVPETSGGVRRVLKQLLSLLLKGQSIPDAFAAMQPTFGSLEVSMIEAASNTGRLEQAFVYLVNYFGALETLRSGIIKRSLWPVIQLHFGVLVANVIPYITGGLTWEQYLVRCGLTLGAFYVVGLAGWIVVAIVLQMARASAALDRALGMIPLLGKLRRYLALSRFCATYEMQLQAGINAMDSVRAAGDASQSARIRAAVTRFVPKIRAGVSLGSLITGQGAFPTALKRSIRLGEESGSLDADLVRWSGYYQKNAVDSLETLGTWISRFIYLVVAGYFIYAIINAQMGEMHTIDQMLNSN